MSHAYSTSWPDAAGTACVHLDLQVDEVDEAAEVLCALGASQPGAQPGASRRRVLLDPDGRPFVMGPRPSATP
ncbi:MAG: hypothetical protein M0Z33_11820 [Actinomycetota bacterium]|nr:hypothetical protein [Actinomycetota bacterium]